VPDVCPTRSSSLISCQNAPESSRPNLARPSTARPTARTPDCWRSQGRGGVVHNRVTRGDRPVPQAQIGFSPLPSAWVFWFDRSRNNPPQMSFGWKPCRVSSMSTIDRLGTRNAQVKVLSGFFSVSGPPNSVRVIVESGPDRYRRRFPESDSFVQSLPNRGRLCC